MQQRNIMEGSEKMICCTEFVGGAAEDSVFADGWAEPAAVPEYPFGPNDVRYKGR